VKKSVEEDGRLPDGMYLPLEEQDFLFCNDLQISDDLFLTHGYSSMFELDSQGGFFFPTAEVPYQEGLEYGWMLFLETTRTYY
jgi:hypothetical protein